MTWGSKKWLYIAVIACLLLAVFASGCCCLSGNPAGKVMNGLGYTASSAGDLGFTPTAIDNSKSIPDSNALVSSTVAALESRNKSAYNMKLVASARSPDNQSIEMPCRDIDKYIAALKGAKIKKAYPSIVYYETTLDGKLYTFSAMMEGGEWRLSI